MLSTRSPSHISGSDCSIYVNPIIIDNVRFLHHACHVSPVSLQGGISGIVLTSIREAPPAVFSVELLGSWDNFNKPYNLTQDRRAGTGHWKGCHVFDGITCDGDTSKIPKVRKGALLMGGRYWYYVGRMAPRVRAVTDLFQYRLNGETEYHDTAEPTTSSCPLLPGQPVNILDVPIQGQDARRDGASSDCTDYAVFTLNPKDKYLPPGIRRAATTSAVEERRSRFYQHPQSSRLHLNDQARDMSLLPKICDQHEYDGAAEEQKTFRSVFNKIRRTRSAGSGLKRTSSWHRKVFSRAGSSRKALPVDEIPAVPKLPEHLPAVWSEEGAKVSLPSVSSVPHSQKHFGNFGLQGISSDDPSPSSNNGVLQSRSTPRQRDRVFDLNFSKSIPNPCIHPPSDREEAAATPASSEEAKEKENLPGERSSNTQYGAYGTKTATTGIKALSPVHVDDARQSVLSVIAYSYTESNFSSYATENNFSPASTVSCSEPKSPGQLSQPLTPDIPGFTYDEPLLPQEDPDFRPSQLKIQAPCRAPPPPPLFPPPEVPYTYTSPHLQSSPSSFQGYSLPERDRGSALTLRKPPSTTVSHQSDRSLHRQDSRQDFVVQSWHDGNEQYLSALGELVDDMGYLGDLIV